MPTARSRCRETPDAAVTPRVTITAVPHTYLVESYGGELSEAAVRIKADDVAAATQELQTRGRQVTFLGCLLIPDDEVCFWRFAGTSLADVARRGPRAGLDIQRIARSIDIAEPSDRSQRRFRPTSTNASRRAVMYMRTTRWRGPVPIPDGMERLNRTFREES